MSIYKFIIANMEKFSVAINDNKIKKNKIKNIVRSILNKF